MFKNYFKIAWRNMQKSKLYALLNIMGLATGMAVALLISLWIGDETSFDKDNAHYGQIAQVMQNQHINGNVVTWSNVPFPLAAALRNRYGSDFKRIILSSNSSPVLSVGEKKLIENGNYMEPEGPDLLDLKMIAGTRAGLQDANSILLAESTARAFFGNIGPHGPDSPHDPHGSNSPFDAADALNRTIRLDSQSVLKVTGVYRDLPRNSSFSDLAFVAPWQLKLNNESWIKNMQNPWGMNGFHVYVQFNEGADPDQLSRVSRKIRDTKLENIRQEERIGKPALFLHPMSKWHLYSEFKNGVNTGGRIAYVWLFGIIGAFVLLLACINFMNLSTARSEKRAREVGVRKTFGSLRRQLIGQFLSESVVVAGIAFVFAIGLVLAALPFFNGIAGKKMSFPWGQPYFWLLAVAFSLLTGLLAGSYPAFYLSHFKPVEVLKGTSHTGRSSSLPRKVLVVLQFTVSIILIIGTVVVFRQVEFARNRPVGYSREGFLIAEMRTPDIHKHFEAVNEELKNAGVITAMAESGNPITDVWNSNGMMSWRGKPPGLSNDFPMSNVSYDYGKTVGWHIVEGRDFSRDFAGTDSSAFILNEAAVKYMGFKSPIGERIAFSDSVEFTVVGVVADFIMESPYEPVRPSLFRLARNGGSIINIKINPAVSARTALDKIGAVIKKYSPGQPFELKFVDEEYARKFGDEQRVGKLATVFAVLAIFISCLGLFGLASYTAEQRSREIGIRKVLGSSVFQVWNLLTKEFLWLVMLSLLIAIPSAYYFMHEWLQHYSYRAVLSAWIFAMAAGGSLLITLLTVSFQVIRAAIANPVSALRSE